MERRHTKCDSECTGMKVGLTANMTHQPKLNPHAIERRNHLHVPSCILSSTLPLSASPASSHQLPRQEQQCTCDVRLAKMTVPVEVPIPTMNGVARGMSAPAPSAAATPATATTTTSSATPAASVHTIPQAGTKSAVPIVIPIELDSDDDEPMEEPEETKLIKRVLQNAKIAHRQSE
jgi:hypothetical protein